MIIKKFEDIIAWQKAKDLSLYIYYKFKNNRDYGFKDQITRASISIMNNIAEGFGRKNKKEFVYFLRISKGSSSEVKSMMYIAKNLEYLTDKDFNILINLLEEIEKTLTGLIKSLLN